MSLYFTAINCFIGLISELYTKSFSDDLVDLSTDAPNGVKSPDSKYKAFFKTPIELTIVINSFVKNNDESY